jgi:hypothetical protein
MNTHVTFVLDSSGSMTAIEDDTKGGFNTFLRDQQDEEGEATVTLYDFNTDVKRVYRAYPIEDAPELTDDNYTPGGQTALHDAIYTAVTETADHLSEMEAAERPENVVVVILTDGKENASETHPERVREQVTIRQEEHGWEFLFIGANQDAALTADQMGIDRDRSLNMSHTGEGAKAAYESTSDRVRELREEGTTDGFDEEDRQRQRDTRDS